MIEQQHCGQESTRPILTPQLERDIRNLLSDKYRPGPDGLRDTRARVQKALEPDNSDLTHEWWCEYEGPVEIWWEGFGIFGTYRKRWECPWCEHEHAGSGSYTQVEIDQ